MKSSNSLFFYVNLREGLLFGKYKSLECDKKTANLICKKVYLFED